MTVGGPEHFPGFDVLRRADQWDPVTAGVVLSRLGPPPRLRFFTPAEEATARALLDRLLAQDTEPRVPVFECIDARLAEGETDGWRYDNLPEDGETWKVSLHGLDDDARARPRTVSSGPEVSSGPDVRFGREVTFGTVGRDMQMDILEAVRTADRWHDLPAGRVWSLWMRYACAAFYSHPWAWNEIGFGGPAYPTGYKNLGVNGREGWEVAERDAFDPEPWAHRVERARLRHEGRGAGSE